MGKKNTQITGYVVFLFKPEVVDFVSGDTIIFQNYK